MRPVDPLATLARADKHYLSAGDGALFAPRFPLWLDVPGFWDAGHFCLVPVAPLFTVAFVAPDGRELPLRLRERRWDPSAMRAEYEIGGVGVATEHRVVAPHGRFISRWDVFPASPRAGELFAVAWTAQPLDETDADSLEYDETRGLVMVRRARDAHGRAASRMALRLSAAAAHETWAAYISQGAVPPPRLELTPFPDHWRDGLGNEAVLGEIRDAGTGASPARATLFAAIASRRRLSHGAATSVSFECQLLPEARMHSPPPRLPDDAGGGVWLAAAPAESLDAEATARPARARDAAGASPRGADRAQSGTAAAEAVLASPAHPAPEVVSRHAWLHFLGLAPALACSDSYLERYFAYRWYGLRLNFVGPIGRLRHPTVCEGIDFFHLPILYSAPAHARELRWLADPARARGVLLTVLDRQRPDGSLPGFIYPHEAEGPEFYHADLGGALLAVDAVHPERAFLEAAYGPLVRYAEWGRRERDAEDSGLYTVTDPYETGQEFSPRYLAVDPEADRYHFEGRLRLKGVDATVYFYRLRRALARAAAALGRGQECAEHDRIADRIADAVRALMWDPAAQMFSDVDPQGMRRTGVRAAVCFYPYLTDIAGPEHLAGLRAHLLDPAEFWTAHPVPTLSLDDPMFSADGEWRGVRRACPWNGRMWPMASSHVMEALGRAAELDPALEAHAAEFLRRFVQTMFFDGDPARPNAFEHYNPLTGHASLYRGIDDYQHSWVNDLIIRYAAGVRVRDGGALDLHPLPLRLERLRLDRVPFRGHVLAVEMDGARAVLTADGCPVAETAPGSPARVELRP